MPQGIAVSNVCVRACVCVLKHTMKHYTSVNNHTLVSLCTHTLTPLLSYKRNSVLNPHRDVAKQLFIEYYEIFQLHIENGMKLHGQPIYVSLLL